MKNKMLSYDLQNTEKMLECFSDQLLYGGNKFSEYKKERNESIRTEFVEKAKWILNFIKDIPETFPASQEAVESIRKGFLHFKISID